MDALRTLQPALVTGGVQLNQATVHPNVWIIQDRPEGELRNTYAYIEDGQVKSIAQLVHAAPIDGIPCLSLGYATMEDARGRGLATVATNIAIADMRNGLRRHGIRRFYIEGVVSQSNDASNHLAAQVFGTTPQKAVDQNSGEPIFHYVKLITS